MRVIMSLCVLAASPDNAFTFTVPADFLKLGSRVPGFKGCKVAVSTIKTDRSRESRTPAPRLLAAHPGARVRGSLAVAHLPLLAPEPR